MKVSNRLRSTGPLTDAGALSGGKHAFLSLLATRRRCGIERIASMYRVRVLLHESHLPSRRYDVRSLQEPVPGFDVERHSVSLLVVPR
jgi:hypothetical protein